MNLSIMTVIVAILGVLVGGVVNVLADDLPMRRRPQLPQYPDDTPRPMSAWLGLTAFLLGKRTSPGGAKLSWRYPLTEIATSALMVLTLIISVQRPEISDLQMIFWLIYMPIFVLITVIDIEHKLILFVVIIPTALLAIVDALLTPFRLGPALSDALIGGVAGFIVFFILYNGGFLFTYVMGKIRGREINEIAFGYGDVMLATVSGLILGWRLLIFAMLITAFLGAFGAIIFIISRRIMGKRYSAFTALPYGPYIVAGTLLMMLFTEQITNWMFGGFN